MGNQRFLEDRSAGRYPSQTGWAAEPRGPEQAGEQASLIE